MLNWLNWPFRRAIQNISWNIAPVFAGKYSFDITESRFYVTEGNPPPVTVTNRLRKLWGSCVMAKETGAGREKINMADER